MNFSMYHVNLHALYSHHCKVCSVLLQTKIPVILYRYRKCVRRLEDGVREPCLVVPQHEEYPREKRQPPGCVAPELVFFCRRVYDFRQRRILKNPG